jgi:hypothetical protein
VAGKSSVWGKEQQCAFNDLKHLLCSTSLLSSPDMKQLFEIDIDAFDYVVGEILTQHGHQVAYHSETLSYSVQKHPTYDKEMYSIVHTLLSMETLHFGKGDNHPH